MIVVDRPDLVRTVIEGLHNIYKVEKPLPHTTELIYCLTRSYLDRTQPVPPTDREILLWVVGFGLEDVLLSGKVGNKVEPRMPIDGIHYTPDFLWTEVGLPGEVKTTRTSSKRIEAGDYPVTWLKQIMAYCYGEGVTEYMLMVLCLMGNYRPPFPQLHVHELHFTKEEIELNWTWLQSRYAMYMMHMEGHVVPTPFAYNEDWECENCRHKLYCDSHNAHSQDAGSIR